jgi:hypothetical protein
VDQGFWGGHLGGAAPRPYILRSASIRPTPPTPHFLSLFPSFSHSPSDAVGRSLPRRGGGSAPALLATMEHYPAPGRNHLFVPDPTNDLEPILRAINRSNEDHRSPAFSKLSKSVLDDVKQIFRTTTATSFIFSTTGWLYTSPWTPLLSFHNSSTQFERPAD